MKTLQNNFTTIEQSKRLLELGVPAWTSDLRYRICKANDSIIGNPYITKGKKYIGSHFNYSLPCWSVGRLIELYMKARGLDFMYFRIMSDADMIDSIIRMFVENQNEIDFLKLEE